MRRSLAAGVAGLLFGLGLAVSRMTDPAKVLGFLDVAGPWDPSLAFVLAGATGVAAIGFPLVLRGRAAPLCDDRFHLPTARRVDRRLLAGAALFGVSWGLDGLCPGPALADLVPAAAGQAAWPVPVFVAAMLAGMGLFELVRRAAS